MKKFLCIFIFAGISLFAQNPPFNGNGDGSEISPYQLWTKADLKELHDSMLNTYYPNNSTWHRGKHFRLMQDINNIILAISSTSFAGHFHGNGKKITVAISTPFPPDPYNVPFPLGSLGAGGTIDSLTVDGYVTGNQAVGVVATNNGTISQCINNATIICINPITSSPAGIAGNNRGTISHCINNGDITGVDRIGGIAGNNDGGQIINCINTGKITATNSGTNTNLVGTPTPDNGVGGIVAASINGCLDISNCINTGEVVGQGMVGGIIGVASYHTSLPTKITNCVNYGFIKGTNLVGGIIGYMFYPYVNISNCINAGVVEGETDVGSITGKE